MKNPAPSKASASAIESNPTITDVVLGAAAGAAGVWAMDQIGWLMLRAENPQALARDLQARPRKEGTGAARTGVTAQLRAVRRSPMFGKDTTAAGTLKKATQVSGVNATNRQPGPAATVFHYGLGMLPGFLYGVARRSRPRLSTGCGALYGLGLFVAMDETAAPLVGIASSPSRYPWQAHARGLVAHLILGMTTEILLRATDQFRQAQRR